MTDDPGQVYETAPPENTFHYYPEVPGGCDLSGWREFTRMMTRSAERCFNLSKSELIYGYVDNHQVYQAMSEEARTFGDWVYQLLYHPREDKEL
jgi:hypothetical protein